MENENSEKKYYLGLDIGTNSVGWAVTDEHYKLIKKDGKHLWGARLFDEGKDASSRRSARNNRRRLKRRRERILILRSLFQDEIDKIDPNFFKRLDLSFFQKDDIEEAKDYLHIKGYIKNNFIFENSKQVKEFYKKYPTIYHLRKALIEEDRKFDIREIYLAVSHMIKYRGNFLYPNFESVDNLNLLEKFNELNEIIDLINNENENFEKLNIDEEKEKEIKELFKSEGKKNILKERLTSLLFSNKPTTQSKSIIELLCGTEKSIKDIFKYKEEESYAKEKINLEKDEYVTIIKTYLNENEIDLINKIKEIYDLRNTLYTLKGETYISYSMVERYNKHKKQLKVLKELVKKYVSDKDKYENFFNKAGDEKNITYARYVGFYKDFNKEHRIKLGIDSVNYDDFIKSVKNLIDSFKDNVLDEDKGTFDKINNEIESKTFLLKQNSKNNGTLPYQLNKIELKKIIENQSKYYSFLSDKDKSFIYPSEEEYKLVSLLEYKIPYFVGPLSDKYKSTDKNLNNHWSVKKDENIRILPWNFYDVIDEEKCSEQFMNNLKNTCTYIMGEETLPKKSIYFQVFCCLNELNSFLLNGEKFVNWDLTIYGYNNKNLLEVILEEVYLNKKTVKFKDIRNKIKEIIKDEKLSITTKNIDSDEEKLSNIIKTDLSSVIDFKPIFGDDFYNDKAKLDLVEDIIKDLSIFTEEKPLINALKKHGLLEDQIKKIKNLKNYSKFATLSKKLLVDITINWTDTNTGEVFENISILRLMLKTGFQFMEIYESKDYNFGFKEKVECLNNEFLRDKKLTPYELIDEYPLSNLAKRPLRQVCKIVNELNHILNKDRKEDDKITCFSKIFIETTREKDEKKKGKLTDSRKKQLDDWFKAAKKVKIELGNLESELNANKESLKSKKLFLYFAQLGRDVYTGEKIDLSTLLENNNVYDIDHIIPQSYIKDDSFNNTVLTSKVFNNSLSDKYPFGNLIKKEGVEWIKKLNEIKVNGASPFMPKNKMDAILRNPSIKPLEDEEISGFINRQLPVTNQANKYSMELLNHLTNANIIYSKASHVSDFRNIFNLYKIREINNFHHAHDALLNIVLGDIYDQKFTNLKTKYEIESLRNKYPNENDFRARVSLDPQRIFKTEIKGRDNNILWHEPKLKDSKLKDELENRSNEELELIKKQLSYSDVLVSYMRKTQIGDQGIFSKITVNGKGKNAKGFMKLKDDKLFDPVKYGGYNGLTNSFFTLISKIEKDRKVYSLIGIKANVSTKFNENYQISDYVKEVFKDENVKVEKEKILIEDLIALPIKKYKKIDNQYIDIVEENLVSEEEHNGKYYSLFRIAGITGDSLSLKPFFNPHYSLNRDFKYIRYIKNIIKFLENNEWCTEKDIINENNEFKIKKQTQYSLVYEFSETKNYSLFEYLKTKLDIPTIKSSLKTTSYDYFINLEFKNIPFYSIDKESKKLSYPQFEFLKNLVILLKGENPDFNKYGGKKGWGKQTIKMNNLDNGIRFVKYSPTGFYKHIIFEVK